MKKAYSTWAHKSVDTVFESLSTNPQGLHHSQIQEKFKQYGKNELASHSVGWWSILHRQLFSPFSFILMAVVLISFVLREYIDGVMVLLFFLINISLSFFQEYRSEKSVEQLGKFITSKIHVLRDGKEQRIESAQIVPGDVVILEAGDIVPADMRLTSVTGCTIDESSLTGESVAVEKISEAIKSDDFFSAKNIAFSGTHVLSGRAVGIVFATGMNTQIGEIADLTQQTQRVSGFEKSITEYSEVILKIIFFTLLVVIGLNIALKYPTIDMFSLLFFSVALAISVIPEGLPVVTTLALSQGALSLAKLKVVVKRLSSIEDLGSIEFLCTDKTGTLTQNVLHVSDTKCMAKSEKELIYTAAVGSSFLGLKKKEPNNSFDLALWKRLSSAEQTQSLKNEYPLLMPFDPQRKRSTVLLKTPKEFVLITRGVPELLIRHAKLSKEEKKDLEDWAAVQGSSGKRVLAIVSKKLSAVPKKIEGDEDLVHAEFLGLISFEDPLKSTTRKALAQAKLLGVQVKILTGDGVQVSAHVAQKVGLIENQKQVITGDQLEALSLEQQQQAVLQYHVFSRVTPEQKHSIIHLLEHHAHVGFLGEGINDAPALKSAHVGIVVHGASDIAVQAADVVLLDNDLQVIIEGIRRGREIFTNTVKYIKTTLASNFGNFFAVAVASLLTTELPMLPLQLLLLNLLSDFPMIAIATDTVDPSEVTKPKQYEVAEVVTLAALLGVVSSFFDFTFFAIFSRHDPAVLQTYWFIGSVLTELVFMFSIRVRGFFLTSIRPSITLIVFGIAAAVLSVLIPFTLVGRAVFSFIAPTTPNLTVVLFIVCVYLIVSESTKLFYYHSIRKKMKLSQTES